MNGAGGDGTRRAGTARQRVRLAAEAIRAEDRERDRLASLGRDAELVGGADAELRSRLQLLHQRRVAGAAARDHELVPRSAVERAPDRLDRERGRGRYRVVEGAARVLHLTEEPRRERRAEVLAAR